MHTILWLIFGSLVLANVRGMQSVFTQITSTQPWGAQRYFLLACWCFAFLMFLGMEIWKPAWPGWKKAAVVALFVYGGIGNFQVAEHQARGWGNYVPAIEAWEADRRAGHAHGAVSIPIDPPGWVIELSALQ